jgi:hypothetical protein
MSGGGGRGRGGGEEEEEEVLPRLLLRDELRRPLLNMRLKKDMCEDGCRSRNFSYGKVRCRNIVLEASMHEAFDLRAPFSPTQATHP